VKALKPAPSMTWAKGMAWVQAGYVQAWPEEAFTHWRPLPDPPPPDPDEARRAEIRSGVG
jgi:hypothetical protein